MNLLFTLNQVKKLSTFVNMKIGRFIKDGELKFGAYIKEKEIYVDFTKDCESTGISKIQDLLENWNEKKEKIQKLCENEKNYIKISNVKILPPIEKPKRIIGLGGNYPLNGKKGIPFYFEKSSLSITGNNCSVILPKNAKMTDYEGELVVIIGKGGKYITKEKAMEHIGGYTICNDLTEKGYISETNKHIMFGKSIETFLPIGPYILMADYTINPSDFKIETFINGKKRQSTMTSDMIISIPEMIETISKYMHLYPGDMILTGTPDGTGSAQIPPEFLKNGDCMEIFIPKIGKLVNYIKNEQ